MQRTLALVATFALASSGAVVAGTATKGTSFAFGRTGGNIAPFTIKIASDGSVTATGPAKPLRKRLTYRALTRLATLTKKQRFFSLRQQIRCPGTLPDFAFSFITVRTVRASRIVLVRGDCSPAFNRLYAALSTAVGTR
jgi:hypothetical protein